MADKRITTVDEMRNPDQNADFVLVVRGTQKDLRRLRLNLLPADFDLHDDVANEMTSLAGIDRLLISDEGSPGAPQKYVKLSTLRSFFTNLFDLHDDVATELTTAADGDRLLISDEDQAGDPQKWISVLNLLNSRNVLRFEKLTDELPLNNANQVINHSLGRVPVGFQFRLICKTAEAGYSAGDETYPVEIDLEFRSASNRQVLFYVTEASATSLRVRTVASNTMWIMNKDSGSLTSIAPHLSGVKWKCGLTIWG